jgi:hypothetical protein
MNHRAFYRHSLNVFIEEIQRIESHRHDRGGSYDVIGFCEGQGGTGYFKWQVEPDVAESDFITGSNRKLTFQPRLKS